MRTQSIGVQMPIMENVSATGKEKSNNEFDLVLGMNLSNVKKGLELSGKDEKTNLDEKQSKSSKSVDGKAELFQGSKIQNVDQKSTSVEAETAVQDTNDPMINSSLEEEEIIENISEVLEAIMAMLQNVLNLSKVELKNVMEEQQINPEDLLNPEGIQQLILGLNGENDISLFLTNETLNNEWKELVQKIEEIVETSDLNLSMEEVEQILQKINTEETEEVAKVVATEVEVNPVKEKVTVDPMQSELTLAEDEVSVSKVEVATDESRDKGNQQDAFEGFVEGLVQQTTTMEMDSNGNLVQVTQMRDIVNQIVEQIKVVVKPDMTSMTMQLNPEHLGKLQLSVQAQQGVMTAHFTVQNEVVKEALESQIHLLKENLNQQGLKVEEINITVSATPFDQRQEQDSANQSEDTQKKSKISFDQAFMMEEGTMEEVEEDKRMVGPVGGQIDYNA